MPTDYRLPPHRPTVRQQFPPPGFTPEYRPDDRKKEYTPCVLIPSRYPTI